jgi:hypothetical protein
MPSATSLGRDNRIARRYVAFSIHVVTDQRLLNSNHIHGAARWVVVSKTPALLARAPRLCMVMKATVGIDPSSGHGRRDLLRCQIPFSQRSFFDDYHRFPGPRL